MLHSGKSLMILLSLAVPVGQVGLAADKTITRIDDPVEIEGSKLKPLLGSPIPELSLLAISGEGWAPIPFQIDQKKPDGVYAFTLGPAAGPDPDPNLDGNDELAFIVRDVGDSLQGSERAAWPAGADSGVEIEVSDPRNGAKGWVYLFHFSGPAPRSNKDYIALKIDEKQGYRWGISDELVVGSPSDRVYPDYIAVRSLSNGNTPRDVLDRLKIRGELVFPWGIKIPLKADELIKARDEGYIDGAVRALQYTYGFMKVAGVEFKGFGYSTLTYYPNHLICPITIAASSQVPEWLLNYLPRGHIAGYMDFNSDIYGSRVVSAANPLNDRVVLDGKTSPAERALDREAEIDWIAGFGPQGGLLVRLFLGEDTTPHSHMATYYVDDASRPDPPEDNPGTMAVGFNITGKEGSMDRIVNSTTFRLYAYGKADLGPDNLHTLLDILDHPLQTKTRVLEPGGTP